MNNVANQNLESCHVAPVVAFIAIFAALPRADQIRHSCIGLQGPLGRR